MAYNVSDPASFDDIDPTEPGQFESSEFLDDAIRQTRKVTKETFLLEHDQLGHHKNDAADRLPANSIDSSKLQSSSSADSARAVGANHIKSNAVETAKIVDLAVTTAKIAATAVTAAKLATDAVEEAKIKNGAVTVDKLGANAVDSTKLKSDAVSANRAVTSTHIQDNAVTTDRINAKAVTGAKIAVATNKIIVGDAGGAGIEATVGGDLTLAYAAGVASFTLSTALKGLPYILLHEVCSGTQGGSTAATSWNQRPVSGKTSHSKVYDSQNLLTIATLPQFKLKAGTYMCRLWANVAGAVGKHQVRLRNTTRSQTLVTGSIGIGVVNDQTQSIGQGVFTIPDDNDLLQMEHYTVSAVVDTGLGDGLAALDNIFASMEFIRVNPTPVI